MLSGSSPPAPAAALIGRAAEVEDVLDLLGRARLVTLTGPPGVGKTRLALAVCADRDDVSWVDLAPVRDPPAGAGRAGPGLARRTVDGSTDRLVVLDNCEHLLDCRPGRSARRAAALDARLQVLATSRERLRLAAEREYAVPPLPMPSDDDADDPARLRGNPAVALLLDRAPPAVQLTPRTRARALAEICIGSTGCRWRIELAAARLRVFTPSELAFRLERRMSVLTSGPRDAPDRHRDLRAAIAWSHDLLSERRPRGLPAAVGLPGRVEPRRLPRRCCAEPDVLDVVESLLDKSLVRRAGEDSTTSARFTMLMSLREYAAEQLERARRGADHARPRTPTWFTPPRPGLGGDGRHRRAETDDLAAAGRLPRRPRASPSVHARATTTARRTLWLAAALAWFGYTRGVLAEAEVPLGRASSLPSTTNGPIPMRGPPDGWRPGSRPTASGDLTSPRSCSARVRAADGAAEERRGAVARVPRTRRPRAR